MVHGHLLHIGADLDVVRIRNQVREACEQDRRSDYSHVRVSQSKVVLLSLIGSSANGRFSMTDFYAFGFALLDNAFRIIDTLMSRKANEL